MLDQKRRGGHPRGCVSRGTATRAIARALGISRGAVQERASRAAHVGGAAARAAHELPSAARARSSSCTRAARGNLVRVHEELLRETGAELSYQALTAFCRHAGSATRRRVRRPGATTSRRARRCSTTPRRTRSPDRRASARGPDRVAGAVLLADALLPVLPALHALRVQGLPRPTRSRYFGGACRRCMIDNTHVVVLERHGQGHGAGAGDGGLRRALRLHLPRAREGRRQPLGARRAALRLHREQLPRRPQLRRLARRQPPGARVVRQGQRHVHRRHLHASPRELFAVERPHLRPLPSGSPRSTALHQRIVDVEGYVNVDTQPLLGAVAAHRPAGRGARDQGPDRDLRRPARASPRTGAASSLGGAARITDPAHRPPAGRGPRARDRPPEETAAPASRAPALAAYVAGLKRARRRPRHARAAPAARAWSASTRASRLLAARRAGRAHYGLYDLDRLERMVLRSIAQRLLRRAGRATMPTTRPTDDRRARSSSSKSLHLRQDRRDPRRARSRHAEKQEPHATQDFSRACCAPSGTHRQETALAWRIKQRGIPEQWTLETLPLQAAARRRPAPDPRLRRARLHPQGREHRLHRPDRRRARPGSPPACCSRPCRTATAASSSAPRISSTRCTPRSPTARPASCSTASRASTCS